MQTNLSPTYRKAALLACALLILLAISLVALAQIGHHARAANIQRVLPTLVVPIPTLPAALPTLTAVPTLPVATPTLPVATPTLPVGIPPGAQPVR